MCKTGRVDCCTVLASVSTRNAFFEVQAVRGSQLDNYQFECL